MLRTADVRATVEGLFALADEREMRLDNLVVRSAGLEDVFAHYTGKTLSG